MNIFPHNLNTMLLVALDFAPWRKQANDKQLGRRRAVGWGAWWKRGRKICDERRINLLPVNNKRSNPRA